jgi:hypothetical protein
MTSVLVTSASGANGDGYGAILGFSADSGLIGPLSQDRRITDPRGLSHDQSGELMYVNSGYDHVLALDRRSGKRHLRSAGEMTRNAAATAT